MPYFKCCVAAAILFLAIQCANCIDDDALATASAAGQYRAMTFEVWLPKFSRTSFNEKVQQAFLKSLTSHAESGVRFKILKVKSESGAVVVDTEAIFLKSGATSSHFHTKLERSLPRLLPTAQYGKAYLRSASFDYLVDMRGVNVPKGAPETVPALTFSFALPNRSPGWPTNGRLGKYVVSIYKANKNVHITNVLTRITVNPAFTGPDGKKHSAFPVINTYVVGDPSIPTPQMVAELAAMARNLKLGKVLPKDFGRVTFKGSGPVVRVVKTDLIAYTHTEGSSIPGPSPTPGASPTPKASPSSNPGASPTPTPSASPTARPSPASNASPSTIVIASPALITSPTASSSPRASQTPSTSPAVLPPSNTLAFDPLKCAAKSVSDYNDTNNGAWFWSRPNTQCNAEGYQSTCADFCAEYKLKCDPCAMSTIRCAPALKEAAQKTAENSLSFCSGPAYPTCEDWPCFDGQQRECTVRTPNVSLNPECFRRKSTLAGKRCINSTCAGLAGTFNSAAKGTCTAMYRGQIRLPAPNQRFYLRSASDQNCYYLNGDQGGYNYYDPKADLETMPVNDNLIATLKEFNMPYTINNDRVTYSRTYNNPATVCQAPINFNRMSGTVGTQWNTNGAMCYCAKASII